MATSVTLKPNAIDISGSTSGTTTLQASAVAGTTTLTLPAATDTLVGKATTDTLTNKTLTGAAMNGTLGATTPSTASVTTLTTSSTVTHSGGTANGVAYLDGSKVLTTGSALVFDGTNLGVGVTPSAWQSGIKAITVSGANFYNGTSGAETGITTNAYYNAGWNRIGTGYATLYQQYNGGHFWFNAASGSGAISFTQAMTLDAAGALGIGYTTPSVLAALAVKDAGYNGTLALLSSTASNSLYIKNTGTSADFKYNDAYPMTWSINGTERMRLDSSGNLLVGTLSQFSGSGIVPKVSIVGTDGLGVSGLGASQVGLATKASSTSTYYAGFFLNSSSTGVGNISVSTTATAYNTTSDYRLKENVQPMTGALAKVASLKPCTYNWKSTGEASEGFIAHELAEVVPQCVTGEKDAVDADGNPVYQGIDTSFLVATLTAAIKEQQAIIQSLTARITALESA